MTKKDYVPTRIERDEDTGKIEYYHHFERVNDMHKVIMYENRVLKLACMNKEMHDKGEMGWFEKEYEEDLDVGEILEQAQLGWGLVEI